MKAIELETPLSLDDTIDDVIIEYTDGLQVMGKVIGTGPGGWPVVRYEGDEDQLLEVAQRYGHEDFVVDARKQLDTQV